MKHKLSAMICVALVGAILSSAVWAQEQPKSTVGQPKASPALQAKNPASPTPAAPQDPGAAELAAIRAGSDAFVAAFNKGDAKAVAALWTEDGEYIDDTGRSFVGRDVIEQGYAEFLAGNPDAKIQIAIDSVRLLSSNTAIEDGRAAVDPPSGGVAGFTKYTVVHVKVNDKWLMASVRDALIEAPAAASTAADLEWLVGTWVAEESGIRTESVCDWVVEGRFLERKYTTTQLDGTKSSGVQLIGWNSLEGHVQSWNFGPDGGHAVGSWMAQQGGWTAHLRGVTGDGTLTTSINQLRRLDDNAYVWQSVQRSVGNVTLPDTGEVIWKRQPTKR